ncbi:ribonuclease HII [Ardenticatena maritima]|uniref:Ribonuclease HII n=2 Tax=Ardenticatena maritima TaxID=872965 RepID=A0A0P6Y659_9CHLR|nr:ribonuclease HII [Ardenticatena maritima]KPL88223.1 hypothetical protein SE16_05025 [Ardenticatena maritima]
MDKTQLPTLHYERLFWSQGKRYVAGCDEAGRGCWAGPVMVAAVVLPADVTMANVLRAAGVRDSKLLTPAQREALVPLIEEVALATAVASASPAEIDRLGIAPATRLAIRRALEQLPLAPQALLLDAFPLPESPLPQEALVRGDSLSISIAAASILAKVARDRLMEAYDTDYPGYGFARHKGYGTAEHRAALQRLGPTPLHRHTWKPIRALFDTTE